MKKINHYKKIMQYILPLLTGLLVGLVFKALKLPIPAPNVIEGILGILGIYLGYTLLGFVI